MREVLGSLQPRGTFPHFFKALRQRKVIIKITLVDIKCERRILKFFSSYGLVQDTQNILRNRQQYQKRAEPFAKLEGQTLVGSYPIFSLSFLFIFCSSIAYVPRFFSPCLINPASFAMQKKNKQARSFQPAAPQQKPF